MTRPAFSRARPLCRTLLVGLTVFMVACPALLLLYRLGSRALRDEVRRNLIQTAAAAASLIDGDRHRLFIDASQERSAEYAAAVAPLRRLQAACPDVRFIYTMVLHEGRPCIVLDATPPGDADHDGVEDHSPPMQPYDAPAPELAAALREGAAGADTKVVHDAWGAYLSGYAPIRDAAGKPCGVVGVDLRADELAARLAAMRKALVLGLLLALAMSIGTGLAAGWLQVRARSLQALRASSEEALKTSERSHRLLFEKMLDGFALHEIVCDAGGKPVDYRFLAVNPRFEQLTGLKAEAVVGRTVMEVMPGIEPAWIERYGRVALTGEPVLFESQSRELGRCFEVQAYSPAKGQFATVFADITERKRHEADRRTMEEQLRHVQKLEGLGLLAGGIAHDFNNLLMGILGNADLALADMPPAAAGRGNLEQIRLVARQAAELCNQMLAYSGKGRFVVEPLDLSAVVDSLKHLLTVSISKRAALRTHLARDLPAVLADAAQVKQVLMNLVINASEAIGDRDGAISLTTGSMDCDADYLRSTYLSDPCTPGPYVFVEVSDTGCGMDPETCNRVFDPFFTTKFTGRGLGLAAVMGIVRGHKGAIKVYSEPGRGSVFKVLFPASDQPAPPARELPESPAWRGTGTVLLVDDDATVRSVATRMIERAGFAVRVACDGREAVEVFKAEADQIACVVMDLTMPRMDGDAALCEMRRRKPDTPVILSSGYSQHELTRRFSGRGVAAFIQKPYQLPDLIAALRKALGTPA